MSNADILERLEARGFRVIERLFSHRIEIWDPCLSRPVAEGRHMREAYKNFRAPRKL